MAMQASQAANKLAFGAMSEAAQLSNEADRTRLQKQALQILSSAAVLDRRRSTPIDLDVRTSSVENLKQVLESFGHSFVYGWDAIFDICSASCKVDKRGSQSISPPPPPYRKVSSLWSKLALRACSWSARTSYLP